MTEADSFSGSVESHEKLNDAQRRIVDAALDADSGLFVQASVPGSGKTYASGRLCAEYVLRRAADGADRPAAGLVAVAFNRDAAQQLVPKVADWVRWLVVDGTTPAARAVDTETAEALLGSLRRSETIGTIDATIKRVFDEVAGELGFDDPTVDNGYAIDQLHEDAFESVRADPTHTESITRLEAAYPLANSEQTDTGDDGTDTGSDSNLPEILETLLKAARDHGWTPEVVRERLQEGRNAFYPDGPPSQIADIDHDAALFTGSGLSHDNRDPERVVEVDQALYHRWGDRIDDLVTVYQSYAAAYERLCRERDLVSHLDCAFWVQSYFGDPACAHRQADADTPHQLVAASRTRLRKRWQARVDLLVVDEAQDVSVAQHDALAQLVTDDTRTVLYGDPFQSIYTWRNASPTLFADAIKDGYYFGRQWQTTAIENAQITYRQRPPLTNTVNGVFSPVLSDSGRGNVRTVDVGYAPLAAHEDDCGDRPQVHFPTFRSRLSCNGGDETKLADVLAEYVHGGLTDGVFDDGDGVPPIRVLFRSRYSMDAVQEAFERVGLTVGRNEPVFSQPLTRTLVSLLALFTDPLTPGRATKLLDTAAEECGSEPLREVANHVASVDGGLSTAEEALSELRPDAADLLRNLTSLATDLGNRNRSAAVDLTRQLCTSLSIGQDLFEIQPDATAKRRRRIRDELLSAVADIGGRDTSLDEVVTVLTTLCDDPSDGPSLTVDPESYDISFQTVHSYKGKESEIVVLGDPTENPHGRLYTNTVVSRGDTLAVCPPATVSGTADVPINDDTTGLFDPRLDDSNPNSPGTRESGLRWTANRLRSDSEQEYAGPEEFAAAAAEERAEHWRLGYVAATRAREHLIVPVGERDEYDPRNSWASAFGATFCLGDFEKQCKADQCLLGNTVRFSKNDVSSRDPLTNTSPWDGRTPEDGASTKTTIDSSSPAWVPRFLDASTLYPLSEDRNHYVLDHLLGRQLDTDSGQTNTNAPLGTVGPGELGQITHDAITSLIRSDPSRDEQTSFDEHTEWALRRARREYGLNDRQVDSIRTYLENEVLHQFVRTSTFTRLRAADVVYVEEPLETRLWLDDLQVELRGQADFIACDGDELFIEDIKLALAEGTTETEERYQLQLAVYQWLLQRQGVDDAASITSRVTYLGDRNSVDQIPDKELIADRIADRLQRLCD